VHEETLRGDRHPRNRRTGGHDAGGSPPGGHRPDGRAAFTPSLLRLLPNAAPLRSVVLLADLERLRSAYPTRTAFDAALAGVWLPDALTAGDSASWQAAFGFGLGQVSRLAAAGFHPDEVMVAEGRFSPNRVRSILEQSGYRAAAGIMSRGADGSIDRTSSTALLSLSALDRVAVSPSRLVAASATALAVATPRPHRPAATNRDPLPQPTRSAR